MKENNVTVSTMTQAHMKEGIRDPDPEMANPLDDQERRLFIQLRYLTAICSYTSHNLRSLC